MRSTMGYIRRTVVFVVFIQLFGHSQPKTIAYSSYTSDPQQHNATQQHQIASVTQQDASESSGRGFSSAGSGPSFPYSIHPDFLSKPVQVPRPNAGYKTPKYIVYPSYSKNSPNSVPYYNAPVAMDRFAPGEAYGGTIYKLKKQKQTIQSAPFASIPAASFNSPVSVPSPGGLRPAASDNAPVSVLAPPGAPSANGPSPPASPGMQGPPIFMPTPVPNSGEDSSPSSHSTEPPNSNSMMDSSELILSPPNSHSGYLPPANKAQDMKSPATKNPPKLVADSPSNEWYRFPPNTNASYLPPSSERSKHPVTSYLPPPSGDITVPVVNANTNQTDYKGSAELFKFPPNLNADYLPPSDEDSSEHMGTSYGAPPSGDPSAPANLKPVISTEGINPAISLEPNILHRFPPNTQSGYLPPDGKILPTYSATSYIPPPSGDPQAPNNLKPLQMATLTPNNPPQKPSSGDTFKFPPNIHSDYLPPVGKESPKLSVTSYLPPPSGNPYSPANLSPPKAPPSMQAYVPPVDLYKFPPNVQSQYLPPTNNPPRQNNAVTSYLPPASGIPGDDAIGTISVGPGKPQYLPPSYTDNGPPMQSAPPQPPPPPPPMAMMPNKMPPMSMAMMQAMAGPPTGPSGMDADYDHHHDHSHDHHHHDHDFPYLSGFDHDHYPDIIFDHDHDHHHHDEPTTPPAPPPPPPPPETPRLKNYSYYYLSRTLWYVPLYFTLYFTVYVAILIIRSIARHKVNLPNQWVGNGRSFSSIRDLSDKEAQQKATMMATFAMKQIEDFREKYL
uniref:Uncharacterized protein n=1 Tax=Anopheles funestus TaxID=62324 RepID=A0A182RLB9_ANOFN